MRKQKRATAGPARRASLRSAAEEHQAWPSFGVGALLVGVVVVVCMMEDELIDWRYDVGLLQEESDRGMQNKKKVWVQGFSHIMPGLADEPEHGFGDYLSTTLPQKEHKRYI